MSGAKKLVLSYFEKIKGNIVTTSNGTSVVVEFGVERKVQFAAELGKIFVTHPHQRKEMLFHVWRTINVEIFVANQHIYSVFLA